MNALLKQQKWLLVSTLGTLLSLSSFMTGAYASGFVVDVADIAENMATKINTSMAYVRQGQQYAQEVQQVENQYQQLKNEAIQLENFKIHNFADITQAAQEVGNIASQGSALTYSTQNINQQFGQVFGGKDEKTDALDKLSKMADTVLDTSKGTLNSANKQMQNMKGETGGLKQIVNGSDQAGGTKAVLQGTNQLLDASAVQMQSVKQGVEQMQSQQATYDAYQAAKEKQADQADKKLLHYTPQYRKYESDQRLKSLPRFN